MSRWYFTVKCATILGADIQSLSEVNQRRLLMCWALHAEDPLKKPLSKQRDDVIATALRISVEEWLETKQELIERNLLTPEGDPTDWEGTQNRPRTKEAEKQKRYRDREREKNANGNALRNALRNVTDGVTRDNATVTRGNAGVTRVTDALPERYRGCDSESEISKDLQDVIDGNALRNAEVTRGNALPNITNNNKNKKESKPKGLPKKDSALDDLSVDVIADWLAKKRGEGKYLDYDEYAVLEYFRDYCRSNGKVYSDYAAALRNAFGWNRPEFLKGKTNDQRSKPTALTFIDLAFGRSSADLVGASGASDAPLRQDSGGDRSGRDYLGGNPMSLPDSKD